MKLFVRKPWVQASLAWLLSTYLGFTMATMRWTYVNVTPEIDEIVDGAGSALVCFWHGRIALALGCRKVLRRKARRVLISLSPDGELIAKVVRRLGFPAIRGSGERQFAAHDQGSYAASRDAVKFLHQGGVMLVTPDGPVGPAEQMPIGPVMLSRIAAAPAFVFGVAAKPTLTLNSWDKTQIPLPFGRGYAVFDGGFKVARGLDPAAMEAIRADWEARLRSAQARADAMLAAG